MRKLIGLLILFLGIYVNGFAQDPNKELAQTIFISLCEGGKATQFKNLQSLVDSGQIDINGLNNEGFTGLMRAALKNQNAGVVKAIISAGGDPNLHNEELTAIMMAAEKNPNIAIIQELIDGKAEINATGKDNKSALILAAQFNTNPEIIILLLKSGADPFVKDNFGGIALDYAVKNSKIRGTAAEKMLRKMSTKQQ